ncbi:hypothetical protein XAC3810_10003 [Xanthomonas citri pv. citri]|uniref:Uncharacterized protein n=1 Tax=Xanthomonas citri pv. citri TaxID=611301 RepID=A0A0U5F7S3_XANCI|nr:hypothetical protein XAC3824_10003 [Xanthomonas citri pv. citri]CEE16045.1 hypothetical protein XAC9322_10003 [Xanthomonas citri pv. citri]CEE16072.1 hypothetical protein XAC1083_10003 [Xanthomonas citri pv. citri]CEE16808.1 hypothetical protein XAC902_10003 [Xanthomonas citri pv. citri]CEE20231.1 hypothetical protein XAC908_10003 [Xanthomonas citri pv. citri]
MIRKLPTPSELLEHCSRVTQRCAPMAQVPRWPHARGSRGESCPDVGSREARSPAVTGELGARRGPVSPLMPVSSEHTKPEWQGAGARLVDQTDAQPR